MHMYVFHACVTYVLLKLNDICCGPRDPMTAVFWVPGLDSGCVVDPGT